MTSTMTDLIEAPSRRARLCRATPIDWAAVERDYRSGVLSLRDMALKHGCSHSTIANHAGRQGWMPSRRRIVTCESTIHDGDNE
jgi:hypothetical protein